MLCYSISARVGCFWDFSTLAWGQPWMLASSASSSGACGKTAGALLELADAKAMLEPLLGPVAAGAVLKLLLELADAPAVGRV